ncbi:MAG: sugar phosphate isomerase/epimerase, partial [Armatimonadetes bacterium]|nr:sugar phosphate isomerase/epimerase [Armatimonadota bacterium]
MNLICASICYRGYADDEVAATLENAPRIGYRLMEIHGPMTWSVGAMDAFDVAAVRAGLERSGMKCAGLYPPGWGGADEEDVRRRAGAIVGAVRIAEALGADHIDTTGATGRTEGSLDRVIACVRQVLDRISPDSPVRLALENHYGNVLEQPEDYEKVFAAIDDPRVGMCLDTGHFHSARVDTVELIRAFASRIHAVHLKDHIGTASVGIGRGEIDLSAILAALKEAGYRGGLTVELEVEDPQNLP